LDGVCFALRRHTILHAAPTPQNDASATLLD
jgi:hypothetical protein